jgi:hypothetical protein
MINMSGKAHFANFAWVSFEIRMLDFSSIGMITKSAMNSTAKILKTAI